MDEEERKRYYFFNPAGEYLSDHGNWEEDIMEEENPDVNFSYKDSKIEEWDKKMSEVFDGITDTKLYKLNYQVKMNRNKIFFLIFFCVIFCCSIFLFLFDFSTLYTLIPRMSAYEFSSSVIILISVFIKSFV